MNVFPPSPFQLSSKHLRDAKHEVGALPEYGEESPSHGAPKPHETLPFISVNHHASLY
jgi:hypothetical protein